MNSKQVAALLGWPRAKVRTAIEDGVHLEGVGTLKLSAERSGNDYEVDDDELDAFIVAFEEQEPGRHPPVRVRRALLIESAFKCAICRSDAPLQFHHMIEWSELKHHDPGHMLAVCGTCHDKITRTGQIDYKAQRVVKANLSESDNDEASAPEVESLLKELRDEPRTILDKSDEDRFIWMLPRGFLILEDIQYQEYSAWAVTAHYYHFGEGWRTGTHYHSSYYKRWKDPDHLYVQCRKMGIPIGDHRFVRLTLHLIQELRHVDEPVEVGELADRYREQGEPILYFPPGKEIILEELPRCHYQELAPPTYRDIAAELDELLKRDGFAEFHLHDEAASLSRRGVRVAWEHLGDANPSFEFVKEAADRFSQDMSADDVREWASEFRMALLDGLREEERI